MALLPVQLQGKLDLPGCPLEKQRSARARNRRRGRVADLHVGIIELGRVENIESLGAQFQPAAPALIEGEILEQGQIHLPGTRSKQDVSSRVPVGLVSPGNKIARAGTLLDR